jgi:hypothetical protein
MGSQMGCTVMVIHCCCHHVGVSWSSSPLRHFLCGDPLCGTPSCDPLLGTPSEDPLLATSFWESPSGHLVLGNPFKEPPSLDTLQVTPFCRPRSGDPLLGTPFWLLVSGPPSGTPSGNLFLGTTDVGPQKGVHRRVPCVESTIGCLTSRSPSSGQQMMVRRSHQKVFPRRVHRHAVPFLLSSCGCLLDIITIRSLYVLFIKWQPFTVSPAEGHSL